MLVGYARASTQEKNLELQLSALKESNCEKLYQDQLSSTRNNRPGLQLALEALRAGDTLIVWKLDRLGRTVEDLIDLVNQLHQKNIHFKSIADNIDTSTSSGHIFFHVVASLAQMEQELVAERTKVGLAAARAQGKVGGRKRKMTRSKLESAKKLLGSGMSPKDVAQNFGVSIPTLYRWIPASSKACDLDLLSK